MQAVILIGIQASGKSTFYAERFSRTHVRINLDMLKTRHREACFLRTCLETKQAFVVDNTNVTVADRARYIVPARTAGFRVTGYFLRTALQDSIRRNAARAGKAAIPEPGIHATHKRLEPPTHAEGFDELFDVTIERDKFVVADHAIPAPGGSPRIGGAPRGVLE
jgi:predicted kinase